LRAIAALVMGASAWLAWHGPGKTVAPQVLSRVYLKAPANGQVLSRAVAVMQAARAARALPAAAPGVRARPHPATAARQRSRQR
jgi:hypothetical protein